MEFMYILSWDISQELTLRRSVDFSSELPSRCKSTVFKIKKQRNM